MNNIVTLLSLRIKGKSIGQESSAMPPDFQLARFLSMPYYTTYSICDPLTLLNLFNNTSKETVTMIKGQRLLCLMHTLVSDHLSEFSFISVLSLLVFLQCHLVHEISTK